MTVRGRVQNGVVVLDEPARLSEGTEVVVQPVPKLAPLSGANGASFLSGANRLDKQGRTDSALDLVYDAIDDLLRRGDYPRLDHVLTEVPVADYSVDLLLGILTATLPGKSRLPSRSGFFGEVERALKARGEYDPALLTGLEG
jgi:hypothetical protein